MGHITIGEKGVESFTDEELRGWLRSKSGRTKPRKDTLRIWLEIMRVFDDVGTPMTVRQMFYRLLSLGVIQKAESQYKRVAYHLLNMRRLKIVPYNFISDNTRWMRKSRTWDSLTEMLEASASSYRRALWTNQPYYCEIWLEKDALAGVFNEITTEYDVPLMVTRGFPSETFVYEAAQEIIEHNRKGKACSIFYYGDYDPSGVSISTNLEERLQGFGAHVAFSRAAVTPEQITTLNLETRPTKRTDSRAKNFQGESVELDAVHPATLRQMVREAIESVLDARILQNVREAERLEKESLLAAVNNGLFADLVELQHYTAF